jgi:flagellar hook-associated protein 3 FlgL
MMLRNASSNINGNKVSVDSLNNQMTTQKKIQRPSEDPVVAIRALRLRSTLSEIDQYLNNNISDAEAWLETTETSITNIISVITDIRYQCTYGATGSLKSEDRNTILTNLEKLRDQIYSEGNADYAGRTIFTGYRTNQKLTFMTEDDDTTYNITQSFSYSDMEEHRYYSGDVTVPTSVAGVQATNNISDPHQDTYSRLRLSYALSTETGSGLLVDNAGTTTLLDTDGATGTLSYTKSDGTSVDFNVTVYDSIESASTSGTLNVPDDEAIFVKETGELILGKDLASDISESKGSINIDYTKKGFSKGEVRPEYYFNCQKVPEGTDAATAFDDPDVIRYIKYDEQTGKQIYQGINYVVSANQTLTVNTEADEVLNADIGRDVDEMIEAVSRAISANQKVEDIEAMQKMEAYKDDDSQAALEEWLTAAKKERDYADDNLQKLYNTYIGNFDDYLEKANLALTEVGSKGSSLALTKNRVTNQQTTVETLKSQNEDRELSDIILDYTSAYTAYEASLQAASKLNQTTLLNYL